MIAKKYICDGSGIIGYFSGLTFLNMLGLSSQMPNVLELYTNKEPSRVREVPVGSQRVLLRRARTAIDSDNAATLSFLELMNFTDAAFYDAGKKKTVAAYIEDNGITRSSIAKYAPCFPDRAMRTLVESGVVYDLSLIHISGSCGRNYHKHEGFCLETQFAPDSINHPEFPDSVLYAGEKYDYTTIFAFIVDGEEE